MPLLSKTVLVKGENLTNYAVRSDDMCPKFYTGWVRSCMWCTSLRSLYPAYTLPNSGVAAART
eukprot:9074399-Karenia_brevis.AAC.1